VSSTSKTPSEAVAASPATQSAPTGKPDHPGLTMKEGFYFFRDEYQLPKEPTVDEAEARYLGEVEKAFQNRWVLHPNLIPQRTDAQLIKHAYDLDFRENEIKRIRDILPVDEPVFDYIDALVDVVMLKNLEIYVGKRFSAYKHIVYDTHMWFGCIFVLTLAMLFVAGTLVFGLSIPTLFEFAPIGAVVVAALVTWGANVKLTWPYLRNLELKAPKEKYEEAVRDAAGLAASKLATKGRDVENLMNSLKNKLDTMSSPDASRVEHAPKLVRILLWNPERMGLIENYYRAKMDQFMVNSARVSIDGSVKTQGIIYNRRIFMSVLAASFVFGVGIAWFKANLHSMWNALPVFALVLAAVAAVALSSVSLACLSHTFEPQDVARHNIALQRNGIRAAGLAVVFGLAPMTVILVFPKFFIPTVAFSFTLLLLAIVWFAISVIFARLIFQKYKHEYSSNVLEAVQKKMDASSWTRYSDLRIDQRLADVFTAIYEAWRRADSKGVFGSTT
jgi:hypothetical protein